ncbi:MAG: hypothetical protein DSY84_05150, partial [Candidatus Neomarinimicrobiota bacterium]
LRRRQQPARVSGGPAPHRGLGLEAYGRATSPMRRYVDLLVHQQLRAVATGAPPPWDETALMERAAQAETASRNVRAVERARPPVVGTPWVQRERQVNRDHAALARRDFLEGVKDADEVAVFRDLRLVPKRARAV